MEKVRKTKRKKEILIISTGLVNFTKILLVKDILKSFINQFIIRFYIQRKVK